MVSILAGAAWWLMKTFRSMLLLTKLATKRVLGKNAFASFEILSNRNKNFYEKMAEKRMYFYVIDTRGRLYLEETQPKNIATCMKDGKFLDFFFKNLRLNSTLFFPGIMYVSLCGKELNFVTATDKSSAFVFVDFINLPKSN